MISFLDGVNTFRFASLQMTGKSLGRGPKYEGTSRAKVVQRYQLLLLQSAVAVILRIRNVRSFVFGEVSVPRKNRNGFYTKFVHNSRGIIKCQLSSKELPLNALT